MVFPFYCFYSILLKVFRACHRKVQAKVTERNGGEPLGSHKISNSSTSHGGGSKPSPNFFRFHCFQSKGPQGLKVQRGVRGVWWDP